MASYLRAISILLAVAIGYSTGLSAEIVRAATTCKAQDVRGAAPPGKLLVTDFSVARFRSPCPTHRIDIEQPIAVRRGEALWVWFRLEGDLLYLESPESARQIFLVVGRQRDGPRIDEFIPLSAINRQAAREEAELADNRGHFDWRIDGYKQNFYIPGTYFLELAQGTSRICFMYAEEESCRITLAVE